MQQTVMRRLASIVALYVLCLVFWGTPALAHARLLQAEPAAGATLENSPEQVRLRFSEPVDAEFSPLEVYGPDGARVDRDDARLAPDDARVVEVSLEDGLPEGSYEVEWRVTSLDGHVVEGGYGFDVAAGGGGQEAGPPPEPRAEPAAQQGGTSAAIISAALLVLVVVVVLVGVASVLRRR